jgi:hypothetical protein
MNTKGKEALPLIVGGPTLVVGSLAVSGASIQLFEKGMGEMRQASDMLVAAGQTQQEVTLADSGMQDLVHGAVGSMVLGPIIGAAGVVSLVIAARNLKKNKHR